MATTVPGANRTPSDPGSGPSAKIAVEHVLDSESPFKFRLVDTASRVLLTEEGAITIKWQPDDPPAQLQFRLKNSDPGHLDGVMLGWRGDEVPTDDPRPVTYSVVALPDAGQKAAPRTLIVRLGPGSGTYTYSLHVAYPTGETARIDPKIYNQGDGEPPTTGQ